MGTVQQGVQNGVQKRVKKGSKKGHFDPFLTPFWTPFLGQNALFSRMFVQKRGSKKGSKKGHFGPPGGVKTWICRQILDEMQHFIQTPGRPGVPKNDPFLTLFSLYFKHVFNVYMLKSPTIRVWIYGHCQIGVQNGVQKRVKKGSFLANAEVRIAVF